MWLSGPDNPPLPDAAAGDRLVFFEYCISLIVVSLRLRPGQRGWIKGLPYTMLTLMLGWWCIPWGLLYTPLCLWTNLSGGRRITAEELQQQSESATCSG